MGNFAANLNLLDEDKEELAEKFEQQFNKSAAMRKEELVKSKNHWPRLSTEVIAILYI